MANAYAQSAHQDFIKTPTEVQNVSWQVTAITLWKGRTSKAFVLLDSLVVTATKANDTNAINANEASMATNWVSPINSAARIVARVCTVTRRL
jgi:hypothetical protein